MPLHRQLAESGQVELTTTPFYHPILPLLFDKKLAREAMPDVAAAALHRRLSRGRRRSTSAGPSSSTRAALRQAAARHVAGRGVGLPGDAAAAGRARHPLDRHRRGDPQRLDARRASAATARATSATPSRMYRPYKVARRRRRAVGIVFRDHALSDLIGFHYQRSEPEAAADDFMNCLSRHRPGGRRRRPGAGERHPRRRELLGTLPRRRRATSCARCTDAARTTPGRSARVASAIIWSSIRRTTRCRTCSPAAGSATTSPSGSATRRTTRPGTPCTARANILLRRTSPSTGSADRDQPAKAPGRNCTSPRAATGSGGTATTTPAPGRPVRLPVPQAPAERLPAARRRRRRPTWPGRSAAARQRVHYTLPRTFLDVKIDGRATFFEWVSAGRYTCQNERGTMAMATHGPLRRTVSSASTCGAC